MTNFQKLYCAAKPEEMMPVLQEYAIEWLATGKVDTLEWLNKERDSIRTLEQLLQIGKELKESANN